MIEPHACQSECPAGPEIPANSGEFAAGPMSSPVADPSPRSGGRSVYLETFGCQMNELDSELVRGQLGALGYRFTADAAAADVILYNTCSVREQAENKVWSRVGLNGIRKREGASFILGVIGCMAEREGAAMIRKFPQIDLMCGPGELDKLPMLIDNACKTQAVDLADRVALQGSNSRRSSTLAAAQDNLELLDLSRAFDPGHSSAGGGGRSAYVRITRGCNKFCTYCVVPYTRGAEVHRPPDSIIEECRKLADQGIIEITLLGQTVNHYLYTHGTAVSLAGAELPQVGPVIKPGAHPPVRSSGTASRHTTFAELLRRIHDEVPAIRRLRFVTSFPRDFGDDILQVMAESPRICRYLHVPAQSGSDRILKLMNRGYTAAEYLEFIDRARAFLPDVCIAGDFIVGFPTETDDDFALTKALLARVGYKNSFIFKYSPRPGTIAIDRFADDVPDEVKRRRNSELLTLQNQISARVHAGYLGQTVEVFVDQVTQRAAKPASASHRRVELGRVEPGRVELAWERTTSRPSTTTLRPGLGQGDAETQRNVIQLSGRTPGDLIAVFDLPEGCLAENLLGTIIPVEITESGPLLLRGHMSRP